MLEDNYYFGECHKCGKKEALHNGKCAKCDNLPPDELDMPDFFKDIFKVKK
jgi:hypothetical protein